MTLILTLIGLLVVIIPAVYWYYNREKAKKIVAGVAVVIAGVVTQLDTELGNDNNNTELGNDNTELIQVGQGDTYKPIDIEPTTNPSQEVTKPIHIQPITNPIIAISDLKRTQVLDNGDEYMKTTFSWKGEAKYIQIKSLDEPWEDKKRETKGNSHTYALNANERFKITLFDAQGNTISIESNYNTSSLKVSDIEYRKKGWHKTRMTWKGSGFTHINYKSQRNGYIRDKEPVNGNSHILWLPHFEDVIVTVYGNNKKESVEFVVSPTGEYKRYTENILYDKSYKSGIAKNMQVELISDMGVIHAMTDKNGFFSVYKHPDRNYKVVAIEDGHRFKQEGNTKNLVWHPQK